MDALLGILWNPHFWLPPNVTWTDMQPTLDKHYPEFQALFYPIPLAVMIFFIRLLVEKLVYEPVGNMLRIPGRKVKDIRTPHLAALETAFSESSKLTNHDTMGLAKRCDMTERQVERWFRHRESVRRGQVSQLDKFKETGWRFTFYLGIFVYGLSALWNKPWFRDSNHFWTDYPFQDIDPEVWWYYMLEMGFYWSLLISQFFDVKRKDFWEMFFHHIITLSLMWFSWSNNCVRVGTMVLLVHDAVDFWLEGAKLAKYARKATLSGIVFGIFAVVWIVTRLIIFPYRVLQFTFPCPMGDRCFPGFHFFNCLLGSLQVLHIFWTFTIVRVIYRAVSTGKTEDVRSDTDESEEPDTSISDDGLPPRRSTSIGAGDRPRHPITNGFAHSQHTNGTVHVK